MKQSRPARLKSACPQSRTVPWLFTEKHHTPYETEEEKRPEINTSFTFSFRWYGGGGFLGKAIWPPSNWEGQVITIKETELNIYCLLLLFVCFVLLVLLTVLFVYANKGIASYRNPFKRRKTKILRISALTFGIAVPENAQETQRSFKWFNVTGKIWEDRSWLMI